MRVLMAALLVLSITGCSKHLRVTFINQSGFTLQACEVRGGKRCISLDPGGKGTLIWRTGRFEITDGSDTWRYETQPPQPFERYRRENDSAITLVISQNLDIFAVRIDQDPEVVREQEQPNGYPLKPHP